jgi:hypothetical protein
VRKFLSVLNSTIFLLISLLISPVSTVYADHNYQVGDGNDCRAPLLLGQDPNSHCAQGLECMVDNGTGDPNQTAFTGVCVRPPETLSCTCLNPNVPASGQNGFRCGTDPNAPVVYCDTANQACINSPETPAAVPNGQQNPYGNNRLKGIRCSSTITRTATCTCANPGQAGSGKNGVNCVVDGTGEQASTYCREAEIACNPAPGQAITTVLLKDSILPNTLLQGVTCSRMITATQAAAKKVYPTVPPPPPPPCLRLGNGGCVAFSSALGELGTRPEEFISSAFAVLLSVSGGIALLLIIKAGYQMLTSQGKPEQINAGRDQLVAAIVGLIFLIFSFVILQVIGFDILRIPGFGGAGAGGGQSGSGVAGAPCDVAGNNQCGNTGLECVATGTGRSGTCQ